MKLFVLLDLNTQDSLNVAYEIIIDSLRISGCGFVGSERKETDSLIESYYFNPWDKFPNGPDYYLILFLRQNTGFFQNLFVLKRPLLSKQLDMSKIENIKGTLDNLVITTDQEIIFLGKTIGFNNKENEKKALNFNEFLEEKSNSYSYKKEVRIPKFILGIIGVIMSIIFYSLLFLIWEFFDGPKAIYGYIFTGGLIILILIIRGIRKNIVERKEYIKKITREFLLGIIKE
jgi:hypothetical protein